MAEGIQRVSARTGRILNDRKAADSHHSLCVPLRKTATIRSIRTDRGPDSSQLFVGDFPLGPAEEVDGFQGGEAGDTAGGEIVENGLVLLGEADVAVGLPGLVSDEVVAPLPPWQRSMGLFEDRIAVSPRFQSEINGRRSSELPCLPPFSVSGSRIARRLFQVCGDTL